MLGTATTFQHTGPGCGVGMGVGRGGAVGTGVRVGWGFAATTVVAPASATASSNMPPNSIGIVNFKMRAIFIGTLQKLKCLIKINNLPFFRAYCCPYY